MQYSNIRPHPFKNSLCPITEKRVQFRVTNTTENNEVTYKNVKIIQKKKKLIRACWCYSTIIKIKINAKSHLLGLV
jgi:hypothetical protein